MVVPILSPSRMGMDPRYQQRWSRQMGSRAGEAKPADRDGGAGLHDQRHHGARRRNAERGISFNGRSSPGTLLARAAHDRAHGVDATNSRPNANTRSGRDVLDAFVLLPRNHNDEAGRTREPDVAELERHELCAVMVVPMLV